MTSPDTVPGGASAIEVRSDGGVGYVVLSRPDRLNALAGTMREEIAAALEDLSARPGIQAVVITGAGRAFCAGADLEGLAALVESEDHEGFARLVQAGARLVKRIREMPVPVIAAVNGVAAGSGAALAIACDLRVASHDAAIGFGFSRYGLHPDCGATHFLPRMIGTGRATELLLTGRTVSASEAERIGLVERLAPAANFPEAVAEFARELAEKPGEPVRLLKRTLYGSAGDLGLEETLRQEAEALMACFRSGHIRNLVGRRG